MAITEEKLRCRCLRCMASVLRKKEMVAWQCMLASFTRYTAHALLPLCGTSNLNLLSKETLKRIIDFMMPVPPPGWTVWHHSRLPTPFPGDFPETPVLASDDGHHLQRVLEIRAGDITQFERIERLRIEVIFISVVNNTISWNASVIMISCGRF